MQGLAALTVKGRALRPAFMIIFITFLQKNQMDWNNYLKLRRSLLGPYRPLRGITMNEQQDFVFFSANLFQCLPTIPLKQHERLYSKLLGNQQLSSLDTCFYHQLQIGWDGGALELLENIRRQPAIICTFHTGSYRLLSFALVEKGIPFSLLVSSSVLEKQGPMFREEYEDLSDGAGRQEFGLIDAEKPTALLQMMRALKNGRSLLVYLDGNTGTGDPDENPHLLTIPFLESHIAVRKGIAWLAQKASVPLHSLICMRRKDHRILFRNNLSFFPGNDMVSPFFAEAATKALYEGLAKVLAQQPWQWENWLYLHRCLNTELPRQGRFGSFRINGQTCILDKFTYTIYPKIRMKIVFFCF